MSRIRVVCTDDRQHPERAIGLFEKSGGKWRCSQTTHELPQQGARRGGVFLLKDGAYLLECSRCAKNAKVPGGDLGAAFDLLVSNCLDMLDVTHLIRIASQPKKR